MRSILRQDSAPKRKATELDELRVERSIVGSLRLVLLTMRDEPMVFELPQAVSEDEAVTLAQLVAAASA